MGQRCYDSLIVHQNFNDTDCVKLMLSKSLSLGVLVGALFYKLPQILKIQNNKSAKGVTLSSVSLELFAVTCSLIYSFNMRFPFMTYGELFFVSFFDLLMIAQILSFEFGGVGLRGLVGLGAYAGIIGYLLSGVLPLSALQIIQSCSSPLTIASRIPQIYSNFRNGHTGQLSFITWFLNVGGTLARVFTTLQEVNDPLVLAGFSIAATLNTIVLLQIIYYWNAKPKEVKKSAAKKGQTKKSNGGAAKKGQAKKSNGGSPKQKPIKTSGGKKSN